MSAASHRIVFLERDSLDATVRRPQFEHTWHEHDRLGANEVIAALAEATIAIVNKTPLRADSLARLPQLKLIAITATGTDNVDLQWCAAHGVVVTNVRNYAVHTVPEHTFALILALRRSLFGYARDVAAGKWQRAEQFCLSGTQSTTSSAARSGSSARARWGRGLRRSRAASG